MSIPGLPSLGAVIADLFAAVAPLSADVTGLGSQPQWGIFLNGEPVVLADNVVSVDYKQSFSISNYPVEKGAFSSYNKTQKPFDIRVIFSKGGSPSDLTAFLASIQTIIIDTNLYDFVTPNAVYSNVNVVHQDYTRSSHKGLGLIVVDVGCEEVRPASLATSTTTSASTSASGAATGNPADAPATFNDRFAAIENPQSPTAAPQVNGGQAAVQDAAQSVTSSLMLPF